MMQHQSRLLGPLRFVTVPAGGPDEGLILNKEEILSRLGLGPDEEEALTEIAWQDLGDGWVFPVGVEPIAPAPIEDKVFRMAAIPAAVLGGWRLAQHAGELGAVDQALAFLQQGYLRELAPIDRADVVTRLLGLFGQARNLRLVAALVEQTQLSPGELAWLEAEELALMLGMDFNDRDLIAGLADDIAYWKTP